MNILLKYLSSEAIENTITCLNFQFDYVFFYGYQTVINEEHNNIEKFLVNKCCVKEVKFYQLDQHNVTTLCKELSVYHSAGNNLFIDFTGSEGICSVAFTEISNIYDIPTHIYDIKKNALIQMHKSSIYNLEILDKRAVDINIDDYIMMVGGIVRNDLSKDYKAADFDDIFAKLLEIKKAYANIWNCFSSFMQLCRTEKPKFAECKEMSRILNLNNIKISKQELINILDSLSNSSLIKNFRIDDNSFSFDYINTSLEYLVLETGSIFERQVFLMERENSDDCKIGVHLDWDGIVLNDTKKDVLNEIDVLRLDGLILTFISCKDTCKLDKTTLYELEAVALRFGGKYAKMKLICSCTPSAVDYERGSLMGIELKQLEV